MSGFPFAPDYLNLLKYGPPVAEITEKKKGDKRKKSFSIDEKNSHNLKNKAAKVPSLSQQTAPVKSQQTVIQPVILNTSNNSDNNTSKNNTVNPVPLQTTTGSVERNVEDICTEIMYVEGRKDCTEECSVLSNKNCHYSAIVSISNSEIKALSGLCYVTLLKGKFDIDMPILHNSRDKNADGYPYLLTYTYIYVHFKCKCQFFL